MRIQKSIAFFALAATFVFALSPETAMAQESNASLQETLTWIKSKADLVEQVGTFFPKPSREKSTQYFDAGGLQLIIDNQCTLSWRNPNAAKLKTDAKLKADAEAKAKETKKRTSKLDIIELGTRPNVPLEVLVSLATLDPEKIELTSFEITVNSSSVGPDRNTKKTLWAVKLSATDDAQKIVWNGIENNVETNSFSLVFEEKQMAERVAKAFRHGIKLCGGKKSDIVKEPF